MSKELRQLNVGLWVNAILWLVVLIAAQPVANKRLMTLLVVGFFVGGGIQHWTYHRLVKQLKHTSGPDRRDAAEE